MASSPPQGCADLAKAYWDLVDANASAEDIEEARVAWELLCGDPGSESGGSGQGGVPPRGG